MKFTPYKGRKEYICSHFACNNKISKLYCEVKHNKTKIYCSKRCYLNKKNELKDFIDFEPKFHKVKGNMKVKTYRNELIAMIKHYLHFIPDCKTSIQRDKIMKEVRNLQYKLTDLPTKENNIIKFITMTIESEI